MIKQFLNKLPCKPKPVAADTSTASTASTEPLPNFRDVSAAERPNLFIKKLSFCYTVFDFSDPTIRVKEKELKRQTLLELVDYVTTAPSKFSKPSMLAAVQMVSANLFRIFSHNNVIIDMGFQNGFDFDEDEPSMDPAWSHLQIVYEFFLRFVASSETDAKIC